MRVTTATLSTPCAGCTAGIKPGDRIVQPVDHRWAHIRCASTLFLDRNGEGTSSTNRFGTGAVRASRGSVSGEARTASNTDLDVDTLTQPSAYQENRFSSHKKWSPADDDHLHEYIHGRIEQSAAWIARSMGRSVAAVQSRILKLYGPDSAEVEAYGTHLVHGELTDFLDNELDQLERWARREPERPGWITW